MLAASTDGLMLVFRDEVDDLITDQGGSDYGCLWKNSEVYRYMTEACDAVATQTDTTYRTIRLLFEEDQATLTLPSYVLEIRSARYVERDIDIEHLNANATDFGSRDDYGIPQGRWSGMFGQKGTPRAFVRDYDARRLRLVPTPNTPGTLEIQCTVTIALPLEGGMPMPLSDVKDQRLVLHYMKSLAYRKQDAETEDLVRAREFGALYAHGVEVRKSQLRNNRRTPGTVRMEW
ncbi:MAG TPA: hypothetical protein PKZ27_02760 [Rhodocyclaceae bacterium]|nr:hypothetical protein [Burkholderiaceae bacterium]HRP74486.1 hypothetical protein [Rhodocyclaceae bacterium]